MRRQRTAAIVAPSADHACSREVGFGGRELPLAARRLASIRWSSYQPLRSELKAIREPSGDHAGALSAIRSVPVSARTAPVATSATRISLRSRSWRGVKTNATAVPSGETAAPHSSP